MRAVYAAWRRHHPTARAELAAGSKTRARVLARLKEGHTVEDLIEAIEGQHLLPHNRGQNSTGAKFLDLDLAVRDDAHVRRYREAYTDALRGRGVSHGS